MNNLKSLSILLFVILVISCSKEATKNDKLPQLSTLPPSNLISNSIWKSGGNITDSGSATVTMRGICWSTAANPTIENETTSNGTGVGEFASTFSNLLSNTTYHVRAYATNSVGTAYGNDLSFTTNRLIIPPGNVPTLSTAAVTNVSGTIAISGGKDIFSFGNKITARGICWSRTANPTTADFYTGEDPGTNDYSIAMKGLQNATTYHVRAYATSSAGTGYGDDISFTTKLDYNGYTYNIAKMGTQVWMTENLRTDKYNDNTIIPTGLSNALWQTTASGAYAIYDNSAANNDYFGKLYNWYAVKTGKLAPPGWHIPTNVEWETLMNYLGGQSVAGGVMKSPLFWNSPNTGATVNSVFQAFGGGNRDFVGSFTDKGIGAYYWTSTEVESTIAEIFCIHHDNTKIDFASGGKRYGCSIRCVKN